MFIRAHLIQILFFFVILFIMLIKMYSIADLLGRVLIVGSILFSFISYFIVKSAIMHTFIDYLNDIGVTDSIYNLLINIKYKNRSSYNIIRNPIFMN